VIVLPFTKKVVPPPPVINLHVETAGTLPTRIPEEKKYQITSLTLTGVLNGIDITYIRDLIEHSANKGGLTLNLEKTTIVKGGDVVYSIPANDVISNDMFFECTRLATITLPSRVKAIGDYAFYGCTRLTTITIPSSVTSIGDYAFAGCTGLKEVVIGENVTSIASSAFSGCTGLTTVTIPNNVKSIGDGAFAGCKNLTSIIIGERVVTIGNSAFADCPRLTAVTIPGGVTSIGKSAFSGCIGLNSITLGDKIKSIGDRAFANCSNLTTFTITNNMSIGSGFLFGCTRMKEIHVRHDVPIIRSEYDHKIIEGLHLKQYHLAKVEDDTFDTIDKKTCKLYIPTGTHTLYWLESIWGQFVNIIEE
jgi:hypothetical protein